MPAILIHPISNGLKIPRDESQRLHLITRWLLEPFASERAVHPKKNAERIVLSMGPCFSGLLKGDTVEADMRTGHGIGTRDSPWIISSNRRRCRAKNCIRAHMICAATRTWLATYNA